MDDPDWSIRPPGPSAAPTLTTQRLRLRAHTLDDFLFYRDMWANPEVVRYIGKPRSEEETWMRFLRSFGHWSVLGFGYWAVERIDTGALIGEVGFFDFKRDITPSLKGIIEAGWAFSPHGHGAGFAGEAAMAALDWIGALMPDRPIKCIIDVENAASIRLAERVGFKIEGETTYQGAHVLLMAFQHP